MNQPEQHKHIQDKKNEIITVAQKRFGQFGLKKTSMIEIAEDLAISKALLYYYFPDKEHLYIAVVEKEIEEFKARVSEELQHLNDPAEKLKEYLRIRLIYFRSFLNLSRLRMEEMQSLNSLICNSWQALRSFEKEIIMDIMKMGNRQHLFHINDPEKISDLLFDLLRGIRMAMIKDRQFYYLNDQDFELLVNKTETFMDIFIKGLIYKKENTKKSKE